MELKRFFRGPLLLVLLAVLVIIITLGWANSSGGGCQQKDTSQIGQLIEQGKAQTAVLIDKNQPIQVTTTSGQQYQADFISGQGVQLQNLLQSQFNKGQLTGGYNVQIPK